MPAAADAVASSDAVTLAASFVAARKDKQMPDPRHAAVCSRWLDWQSTRFRLGLRGKLLRLSSAKSSSVTGDKNPIER